jgi:hypothetical protein
MGGHWLGSPSGLGSFACCFSLADSPEATIFVLFSEFFSIPTFLALCYIGHGGAVCLLATSSWLGTT